MSLSYSQMAFQGDQNIGLHGFATDKYCLLGSRAVKKRKELEEILDVPVYKISVFHTDLAKIFLAGNSKFLFAPNFLSDADIASLRVIAKEIGIELAVLATEKAPGNLIMVNDNGAIVSPMMKPVSHQLSELGIDTKVETIAKYNVVGTRGVCTNKGCLIGAEATETELKNIEKTLKVNVDIGTVAFGSPFPGAGVIANSNGFVASNKTTGIELGRIAEALGFA